MVRMSDILKRISQDAGSKKPKEDKLPIPMQEEIVKETPVAAVSEIREVKAEEGVQISKAMTREQGISEYEHKMQVSKAMREVQLNPQDSYRIYNQGLELFGRLLNKVKNNEPADIKSFSAFIESIVERLMLGDSELISLTVNSTPDNYLIGHCVNVTVLSIEIGLGKGYNKSRLTELGLCALLHDIGMAGVMDIANQSRTISEEEYAKIKEHALAGAALLSRMRDINQNVIRVAKEHHERFNGSGYPEGLGESEINEYSQIIALCDVYEALTHVRPHRKKIENHEAIKELLLLNLGLFDAQNIKILIQRLGVFPVGSWVELNTGEIGKVVSANENFPLRPTVNVMFDMNRQKYPQIKSINLSKHHSIYIKRPADLSDWGLKL
jgi:HD-GYP domain-containing protein (c-di-GMP phosphodiesterase class II)